MTRGRGDSGAEVSVNHRKQRNEVDQSILHCCLYPPEPPHPVDSVHTFLHAEKLDP